MRFALAAVHFLAACPNLGRVIDVERLSSGAV